jgi:hypothetical protein
MVWLLGYGDGLGFVVVHADTHAALRGGDAQVAVAQATHEVKGLARRLLPRQTQRVLLHVLLDGRLHLRRRLEKPVGRYQSRDPPVRTLKVVGVHEKTHPLAQVIEIRKHRPGQKLVPQRLPKPLDLPQRHRVLGPTSDVADPLTLQDPLEARLPAPGRVLAAVVGQELLRPAVLGYRTLQRFQHELGTLVVGQRPAHHEPRAVVHEARQVHSLVAAQQKREDVRLPHLVGTGPLEAARRLGCPRPGRPDGFQQAFLLQDPAHRRR